MSLQDLPDNVVVRVELLDKAGDHWVGVARNMGATHRKLKYGERVPEFSERLPQNLRTYRQRINEAFDSYLAALGGGVQCAESLGNSLRKSALDYLRQEQYGEDLIREIERELN